MYILLWLVYVFSTLVFPLVAALRRRTFRKETLSTFCRNQNMLPYCMMFRLCLALGACSATSLAPSLRQAEPQPDNDEHELQVAGINEDIKKIKDDIEVLRSKIDEANEARRGQGVSSVRRACVCPLHALACVACDAYVPCCECVCACWGGVFACVCVLSAACLEGALAGCVIREDGFDV